MKKLDKITIKNFKSIRDAEVELNSLNIFIGGNGVGKSNFIGVFKLLNNIVERKLQKYVGKSGGADNILYFGRKKSDNLTLELSFDNGTNGYKCKLEPNDEGNFIFDNEKIWFHDKEKHPVPYTVSLGAGKEETRLYRESKNTQHSNIADHLLEDLKAWTIYHFHDTGDSAKVKQVCDLEDNIKLRSDAANLSAFLYEMKQNNPAHFANIEDTIRMVAPFFDHFNLRPSRLNKDKIRLEWIEKGNDAYFNASSLSDGTLRVICLATLLLQPELPNIILLDEPELGLHPHAITVLASLLKKASKKSQVIVATQSVTLLNQFEPDNIFVVDREGEQTSFSHLGKKDIESWLEDYSVGELWEKNILGGRPK